MHHFSNNLTGELVDVQKVFLFLSKFFQVLLRLASILLLQLVIVRNISKQECHQLSISFIDNKVIIFFPIRPSVLVVLLGH
jgi:hypothetical protein